MAWNVSPGGDFGAPHLPAEALETILMALDFAYHWRWGAISSKISSHLLYIQWQLWPDNMAMDNVLKIFVFHRFEDSSLSMEKNHFEILHVISCSKFE